ncbi:hypothetical protein ACN08L_16075 (plasmid) [Photobacterium leiognathi subsp. mandapamensis]|uniref:hypothetical protein n=1 Tax=Photobacterium leiognathi TaxID=553611 RepID=UPI003AF40457
MSGHFNTKGDMAYLKTQFNKNLNAGEKLMGAEFEMLVEEYPELTVLIRSTQFPAMGRADVEDFGPQGMNFTQHGALENKGEITVTAVETLTGQVLKAIRNIVKNKQYVNITIRATPESTSGATAEPLKFRLSHCKVRSDVVEWSTEDTAALVKPSMTIVYNWVDP